MNSRIVRWAGVVMLVLGIEGAFAAVARAQAAPADSTVATDRILIPELAPVEDPRATAKQGAASLEREPRREPMAYAARSLLLPGWGQTAIGDGEGAVRFSLMALAFVPFAAGVAPFPFIDDDDFSQTLGVAGLLTVAVLAAYDAFQEAQTLNRENGYLLDDELLDDARAHAPTPRIVLLHRRF